MIRRDDIKRAILDGHTEYVNTRPDGDGFAPLPELAVKYITDHLVRLFRAEMADAEFRRRYRPIPGPLSEAELRSALRIPEDGPIMRALHHVIYGLANETLEESRNPSLPDADRHFHAGEEAKATEIYDKIVEIVKIANSSAKSKETQKKGAATDTPK